jgi:RHS repeat-associated protein
MVSYAYLGDLVTAEHWAGVVEGSVEWTYDGAFRLVSESVTGGATVPFVYDGDDLLTAAGALSIARSAVNGLAQSAALGVVSESWSYNGFGETIASAVTANAAPVYSTSLTRDDLGRITQKTETIGGVTDTYDYDYDPRGQLVEVIKNSVVIESYVFDDNGNRLNATVTGTSRDGSYDDQDRLVTYGGSAYDYSPSGRLMSRTEPGDLLTTYDYDAIGNLRGVLQPDATEVSYGLDGLDRRVERSVDGIVTQRFLYDGILPVAELDALGDVVSQFVYTGGHVPAYLIRAGVNYRLVTDPVGSVRLVVNAATGTVVQRLDYDTFGNVLLDTNPGFQPFGFAGGLYDPLTGLTLFGSRDYDSHTGRWTAKDPTAFGGGDTNLYRYANNNPINSIDPTGTDWLDTALGFAQGLGEGGLTVLNPILGVQLAVAGLVDLAIGDWLDEHGFYRKPHAGTLTPPPQGVDTSDYLDGYFYGECAVNLASLPIGGAVGASGKLGSLGSKLKDIPKLAKGLGNGLRPAWDEATRLGKKLLDEIVQVEKPTAQSDKLLKGTSNPFDKAKSKPGKAY